MSKKILPLFFFLTISLFLVTQYSFAELGAGCNRGQGKQKQQQVMDAETKKKYDTFMAETVELRKELEKKAMAYQVLMTSENPDPQKAALVTEEYFQLREFITNKAVEAGIIQKRGGCNGCGSGKQGVACALPNANTQKVELTN